MGLADVVSSLPCVLALTAAVGAAQFAYLDVELQLRTLGVLLGSQLLLTGAFQAFSTTFREKPLLAAFEFVSTGFCAYVSWHGVQLAAAHMLPHDFDANSAASRILEEHGEARYYNTLLGGYGLWELGLLLALPDMRSWDNVLHHFFVCVVVVLTMYPGPFGQFYSPYYAGVQVPSPPPSLPRSLAGKYSCGRLTGCCRGRRFPLCRSARWTSSSSSSPCRPTTPPHTSSRASPSRS